jgi:hypothetical protein
MGAEDERDARSPGVVGGPPAAREGRIDRDHVGFLADLGDGDVVEAERPGAVERAESQPVGGPRTGPASAPAIFPRSGRKPDAHHAKIEVGAGCHVRAETDRQPGLEIRPGASSGGKGTDWIWMVCDRAPAATSVELTIDRWTAWASTVRDEPAGAVDIDVVERV